MADNFIANPGAGGSTFASDDIAGVQYPRSKMVFGADGFATDVSAAAPLPVTMTNTLALTDAQLRASAVPVSVSGVATETTLAALNTKMPVQGQALMAASMPVAIASNQSALPVTGTFFQATQPVSAVSLPLPTGASTETTLAALNTKVTAVNTGAVVLATGAATIGAVTGPAAAPLALDATLTNHTQRLQSANLVVTTLSVANTTVTATLAAVAAQFHYITRIRISMHNTTAAAVVGSAVTLAFTSTNLPGSLAWTEGNALAAGASKVVVDEVLLNPVKSSVVNTASTIVAPACGAGVLVRITVYYYTAA